MENKSTNTDYQKVVRVGDQKWEIVETANYIWNHFFAWDLYSLFFIQRVFKFHLKKITPTWSANSHQKSQFGISPSYIHVLENGSTPPSHYHPGMGGRAGRGVRTMTLIFYFVRIMFILCYWYDQKIGIVFAGSLLKLNLHTPKSVCPKSVYWFQKRPDQPINTDEVPSHP